MSALIVATAAHASAVSAAAEQGLSFDTFVNDVGRLLLFGGALAGCVMFCTGIAKLTFAWAERRTPSPTRHIPYSAGAWRVVVGLGLVVIPVLSMIVDPAIAG